MAQLRAGQPSLSIQYRPQFTMMVAAENTQPSLRVVLPGHPDNDSAIDVIFPESMLQQRNQAPANSEHLYLFRLGQQGTQPAWKADEHSFQYEMDLRLVDEPLIAAVSRDGKRVVASFARTTGNVWSNPELTRQHVDPQTSLAPNQRAVLEVKILIFQGSLDQALQKAISQTHYIKVGDENNRHG